MRRTPHQYAQALHEALTEHPRKHAAIIEKFAQRIVEDGMADQADAIAKAFERYQYQASGTLLAELTSAKALSATAEESIATELHRAFKKPIVTTTAIDPTVLGGVRIKIGDTVIDATLRQQLDSLAHHIQETV